MSVLLARGVRVRLGGREQMITEVDHGRGLVRLSDDGGQQVTLSMEEFVAHPSLVEVTGSPRRHDAAADRLGGRERDTLGRRIAHVYEAETGYRSGTASLASADEPRPMYDPRRTTLTQRREAKAAELNNGHDMDAGTKMSVATLRRISKALSNGHGLDGAVDHRHVRRSPGRRAISERVEAACEEVFERNKAQSNKTHAARYLHVRQYMLEVFGSDDEVPCERTVRRWFSDRYLPSELNGKARTRRSATTAPDAGFSRANPTRPGELVCVDTCSLDVLLHGTAYAGVIRGVVVMAVDWYSRSIVAVRVLEGFEQAIDVTFLLREIGRPKSMMPGWGSDCRWPFIGLPEEILTDTYGGESYSGMPFVSPEAIVTDHGSTYKAHVNVAAATQHGISILPARVRSGADKQVVERTFRSLSTMLLQHLSGHRGSDPSERGQQVDEQVKYSVQDIEDLICWWAVRIWQNHVLTDARPHWCPEGEFSPNTLVEYGLAQTGVSVRAMASDDYYALLPAIHVKIYSRGVHIRGLYYDGGALEGVRNKLSSYGGSVKGKWTVRYDPRDLRRVFLLDGEGTYRALTWVGASRHTPCFGDRHVAALTFLRRQRGIAAHDQNALAEVLLREILLVHEPVGGWPSLTKVARKDISRRQRQEDMAVRDQHASGVETFAESFDAENEPEESRIQKTTSQPPSPVAALDLARTRKNSARQPEDEHDDLAAAPPLGTHHMFEFDAAALQAMQTTTTALTPPQSTSVLPSETPVLPMERTFRDADHT